MIAKYSELIFDHKVHGKIDMDGMQCRRHMNGLNGLKFEREL